MDPIAFKIGGFAIYWYGIFVAAGLFENSAVFHPASAWMAFAIVLRPSPPDPPSW